MAVLPICSKICPKSDLHVPQFANFAICSAIEIGEFVSIRFEASSENWAILHMCHKMFQ